MLYDTHCHNHARRIEFLSNAATSLGINAVAVDARQFNYSVWDFLVSGPDNMFYNVTPFSHELEKICIHRGMTGFFVDPSHANYIYSTSQFDVSLISAEVPVPLTVVRGTNDRQLLKKYVEYIGGFPLMVKTAGGTLGIGVMRLDSWEGLVSLADYLVHLKQEFTIKQFISNEGTIRTIVVGDQVVCSVLRINRPGDFRCSSPSGEPNLRLVEISLRAAKAARYEFVGVDIVQDAQGNYFVLEVKSPQDFATPQEFSGIDVAFEAVQYLQQKSQRMADPTN